MCLLRKARNCGDVPGSSLGLPDKWQGKQVFPLYSLCALEHRHLLPSDHGFGAAARFVTAPATIIERHRLQRFKKKQLWFWIQ